jgi:hypothetical protein
VNARVLVRIVVDVVVVVVQNNQDIAAALSDAQVHVLLDFAKYVAWRERYGPRHIFRDAVS